MAEQEQLCQKQLLIFISLLSCLFSFLKKNTVLTKAFVPCNALGHFSLNLYEMPVLDGSLFSKAGKFTYDLLVGTSEISLTFSSSTQVSSKFFRHIFHSNQKENKYKKSFQFQVFHSPNFIFIEIMFLFSNMNKGKGRVKHKNILVYIPDMLDQ